MLAKIVVYAFMIYAVVLLIGIDTFQESKGFRTFIYGGGYMLLVGMVLAYDSILL